MNSSSSSSSSSKISIKLQPIGGNNLKLDKLNFKVDGNMSVLELQRSVKSKLKKASGGESKDEYSIYLLCGFFAPSMDQKLKDLYDCFKVNDELTISYATQEMYG